MNHDRREKMDYLLTSTTYILSLLTILIQILLFICHSSLEILLQTTTRYVQEAQTYISLAIEQEKRHDKRDDNVKKYVVYSDKHEAL